MTAPTYGSLGSGYARPQSDGVPSRPNGHVPGVAGPRMAIGSTPRVLVLVLAAFLVVNFARAHEMVPLLVALRLGKLSGFPLVFLALQRLPRWQLREAMRTRPGRGVLAIGVMMLLSVPLSIWPGNSVGYIRGTGLISYIMFVTTAAVLVDRAAVLTILRTSVLAASAGAARMLLPGAPIVMDDGVPRAMFGYTYDPNDSAALFLVSIPIALYLGNRKGSWRLLWYGTALVMVMAMVRTGSRGGLLGLGAMLAALVLLAPPRQRVRLLASGFAAALAFGIVVQGTPDLRNRFASTFNSDQTDYNYTAANGRIELWKRGIHYIVTHPVTGVGISNYQTAELLIGSELKRQQGIYNQRMFTAHNSAILIGAELGIPGLVAYFFVVVTAFAGLWRVRREALAAAARRVAFADDTGALAATAMTSLTGLFIGGMFLSLAYSPLTLFVFALSAGLIAGSRYVLSSSGGGPDAAPTVMPPSRPAGRRGGLWRYAPATMLER